MKAILVVLLSVILTGIIIDRLAQLYDDWREPKFVPCKGCRFPESIEGELSQSCKGSRFDRATKKRVDSKTCCFSEEVTIKRRLAE